MYNISEAISFQRRDQVWETLLGIQTLLLLLQGNYTDSCVEICRLKVCSWTCSRRCCAFISALSACFFFHFNVKAAQCWKLQRNYRWLQKELKKIKICASSQRSGREVEVENNSQATDKILFMRFPFILGRWCSFNVILNVSALRAFECRHVWVYVHQETFWFFFFTLN